MENLGIASVAAITVITYLMGMAVRASRMDNKWIPILCGLLGGLLGSALLLAADTLAKTAASTELPVSIFTSLLGVPFLLYLILRPGRDAS